MIWFLRLFSEYRQMEARVERAEKAMEDYADQVHDAELKVEQFQASERRMFDEMQLQAKRREDWWAMNARLAPIHFATPDHPQAQLQTDLTPIPGKRLAREVQNEAWEKVAQDLKRQMEEENGR